MKRFFLVAIAAVVLASCSPSAYLLNLEMRCPSESGLDLAGKDVAIVYLETGSSRDSLFNNCLSDGMALGIERNVFENQQEVGVYSLIKEKGGNYAAKDSLVRLVMTTGSDVVILVDAPVLAPSANGGTVACEANVYAYDSMDKADEVRTLKANSSISSESGSDSKFASAAQLMGLHIAKKMENTWQSDAFPVIYFPEVTAWEDAVIAAEEMKWTEAMEIWMKLVESPSLQKQSCAAYNMGLACFMLGQYELALEWLDKSDEVFPIQGYTSSLRKRITSRMAS